MAGRIGLPVIMGRVEVFKAECCGALFMDDIDAERHEKRSCPVRDG